MIKLIFLLCLSAYFSQCLHQSIVCGTTINQTNLPAECNKINKTCQFTNGIMSFANSTEQQQFILCIQLSDYNISIGPNLKEQSPYSIYVEGQSIVLAQNYSLVNDQNIVFKGTASFQSENLTFLSGSLVWIDAPTVQISGTKIVNISSIESDCSCYDQSNSNCNQTWDFNFPNLFKQVNRTQQEFDIQIFGSNTNFTSIKYNSIILYSRNLVQISNSTINSSIIGIFGQNVSISSGSIISTTGNGFPSATGFGCGYFDQILNQLLGCTGSGGSYGGFGGNSWPDNCNLMISRTPYQLNSYPNAPGSGGGFFIPNIKQASSGGGIINIQGNTIDIFDSVVQSDGKAGTQGGGGGSGGSIALDYTAISGNSNISADGGSGKSSGGGGRLWLWNHNWRLQKYNAYLSQFKITAQGGSGCLQLLSCGQNGSISTSPCQPGFQLNLNNFICQFCPIGYYQSQYGYTRCLECLNKPANSQYVSSSTSNLFRDACNYTCNEGYIRVDTLCQSNFMNIVNKVGGINMIISVGIIICVIIGYLIIVLFQKLTEKELFNSKRQQDQFQRKMHFRVQDVPFHEKRVYFSGQNSPSKPWHIPEQTKQSYRKYALPSIMKLDHIVAKLCKQINSIAKYSKAHTIMMNLLKIYYYPLYRYIQQLYRVEKSATIQKLIIQTNKKLPEAQNLGIKFHVQPYCTIACLEIFNYNKSALDFYIQDYFPIYFQLQKMPLGGYGIDLNDPFMKAFITEIDQKHENKQIELVQSAGKVYQKYITQLDELLRNTEQLVPILNHLWMMTQYNPNIQVYLYQHGNKILGVETYYTISKKHPLFLVFSSENINKHHFISEETLKNIYHHKVEYFNNQYKFRQQVIQEDKKSVFWQIQNTINEKVLSWSLGIVTIFLLLQTVISFFILIFIQAQKEVQFTYGITVYFAVFPISQFFAVYLCFRLILSKNCKILADALYFSLGNVIKMLILIIFGMIANISTDFSNILMCIVFYLWILSLVCVIVTMLLKLLLHWHYSRHRHQNRMLQNQSQSKIKIN